MNRILKIKQEISSERRQCCRHVV